MMDAVDKSPLHIDDVVVDDNDDNNDEGIIASDKAEGKKQTTSSCHQCKNNETNNKQGQSICNEHNNSPSNSSLPSSEKVNDVAVIAHRTRSQVTKKASTAAAASNPYQFYYYSGFGPLWGKRRSKRTEGFNNNKKNEAKGKGGENSTIMEANDVATTNLTSSPSSSSQIDNEGFHYIEAVTEALFDIKSYKVAGIDGFQPAFFQNFWNSLKQLVIPTIKDCFSNKCIPPYWNDTLICLIPKTQNPSEIRSFRLVSLCTTLYKIVSKILVNRIKPLLPNIIVENQGAFVKGKKAIDNVIIAQEVIYSFKKKRGIALKAELLAILLGLKLEKEKNYKFIWIESDSMLAMNLLKNSVLNLDHPYNSIVIQCRFDLPSTHPFSD
ncbi:reverse transcriptase [Senna tora]|uniref:Reverse transcriptase n=1 Tax=Senna tora TaxID=362788 RepID=A0A834XH85_9FABA|nr:reverse transcriptase [Senna tora]